MLFPISPDGAASLLLLVLGLHAGGIPAEQTVSGHGLPAAPMILKAASFQHKGMIPLRYTCDGHDLSPQLSWKGVPYMTKTLVLVIEEVDVPDSKSPRVHWVVYNIPPQSLELAQGIEVDKLPKGSASGVNDWQKSVYSGPCPVSGTHRYAYQLFALDTRLRGLQSPDKKTLAKAMQGHVLAKAELIGLYQRQF